MEKNIMKTIMQGLSVALLLVVSTAVEAVQSCRAEIPTTTPSSAFSVNNDGTVLHLKTGRVWKVCSEGQVWQAGQCQGSATTHAWDNALQIPQALNSGGGYAGFSDWRLPNIKELASLVERSCFTPAINETVFPATVLNRYWTASPGDTQNLYDSWGVHFDYGESGFSGRSSSHQVRLVRGGL